MKKTLILYPANILSHLIPALHMANCLKDSYKIYVLLLDPKFQNLVTERGFFPISINDMMVAAGNEPSFLRKNGRKISKWNCLVSMFTNRLYRSRVEETRASLIDIFPAVVCLDIFISTELFVFKSIFPRASMICFNPMLSTYKASGYPTVSEKSWVSAKSNDYKIYQKWRVFDNTASFVDSVFKFAYNLQIQDLLLRSHLSEKNRILKNSTYVPLFDNIPELILAPLELEFAPEVRMPTQHYLGLCLDTIRTDFDVDGNFEQVFEELIGKKRNGSKIIYCSFGTFYHDSDPVVLQFLNNLLSAMAELGKDVEVIFSIKPQIKQTLLHQRCIDDNIHFFSKVPQLRVLQNADLHITHGGLGSIKESIYYEVPMLVYPLDLMYDQNGNGLKVEYHRLGLRGIFNQDRPDTIAGKINQILHDSLFKERVSQFNKVIQSRYSKDFVLDTFTNLVSQDEFI